MAPDAPAERLLSLDAFRGAVVACMLFVNELGMPVESAPRWLLHAAPDSDRYTFTDLVFPSFLFIVGVSIPLALGRRGSRLAQLAHVLSRAAALIVVGVAFEFHTDLSPANTGLSLVHWMSLFFVGTFLAFQTYPRTDVLARQRLHRGLRVGGLALLLVLLLVFRGETRADGSVPWLETQWWGILGLIGWGYLFCSVIYLAVAGRVLALLASMGLMVALYVGARRGLLAFPPAFIAFFDVGHLLGGVPLTVMAGVLAGKLFSTELPPAQRITRLALQAAGLFAAGMLLRPLHGIAKVPGTESFYLVSAGYATAAFTLFYVLFDVRKLARAPAILVRTGQNPLLAYLMPAVWFYLVSLLQLKAAWQSLAYPYYHGAWPAACANVLLVVAFHLALVLGLSKLGVRLQL
jgi:heparan-alpha-glucosaminide N-acetyltransferase